MKYKVRVYNTLCAVNIVEAESAEEAADIVHESVYDLQEGTYQPMLEDFIDLDIKVDPEPVED